MASSSFPDAAASECALWHLAGDAKTPRADYVATEEPLAIRLSYQRRGARVVQCVAITMRTPGHDPELAAGFLHGEGLLASPDEVEAIDCESAPDGRAVCVRLAATVQVDARRLQRHGIVSSACGVCGKTSAEAVRINSRFVLPPDLPQLDPSMIQALPSRLRARQGVFDRTGGLHAAALFDASGNLLRTREDVGRHNALDKLIGAEFLAGNLPLRSRILLLSGRTSFELVQKACLAGLPVVAAVGAPSSLAVSVAREAGVTLLGFLRGAHFNAYSGFGRLTDLENADRRRDAAADPCHAS